MPLLSMENPVFAAYAIAAALMILKLMAQGWVTVALMIRRDAGLLNPEDLRRTPANRNPRPDQLDPQPDVERSRRMQRNDLESIPAFLAAGLLFVTAAPPAWMARPALRRLRARPPRPHLGLRHRPEPRGPRHLLLGRLRSW